MNLICYSESVKFYSRHALKGQKLLAQGIALGIQDASLSPCFTLIEQALSVCNYSAPL